MKLRWLERDGVKVLQYEHQNKYEKDVFLWVDVPTLQEKKECCKEGKEIMESYTRYITDKWNYCAVCGAKRP